MRKILLLVGFTFVSLLLIAQSNYSEAIRQGDDAQKRQDYTTAINKYLAAEAFDPSKKEIVFYKVREVFKKIDDLRKETEQAKENIEKEIVEKEQALNRAEKFINAISFYNEKYALTSRNIDDNSAFYFIDKKGQPVSKLGYWIKAEPFDKELDLAKVTKVELELGAIREITLYLDTLGMTYNTVAEYQEKYKENLRNKILLDPNFAEASDISLTFLSEVGYDFLQKKEYANAEKYYSKIYEIAKILIAEGKIYCNTSSTETIETIFYNGGAYSELIKFYRGRLEMIKQCIKHKEEELEYDKEHENLLCYEYTIYNKIGNLYADNLNEYYKARVAYIRALSGFRELYSVDSTYVSAISIVLKNLAKNYQSEEIYEESNLNYLEYLEKIEPLAKENPEEYQADSANVLLSIGQNYALLEKYRDAEIYYFRSLKIQELLAKKNPDDFPTGLYNVSWCLSVIYSILEDYPNAIHYNNVGKELLFKHKETIDYKPHLAQNYGNLSWCYLFTKEYSQSEQSAHRALELDSINFSKTNLAHALLFQNRFSEAEAIYKELSQTVYTENKTYTPALLDDFNKLEKAGVIPEERKEDVERIRKLLNE